MVDYGTVNDNEKRLWSLGVLSLQGFIHNTHRHEEILSLERLDDSIPEDTPVQFIDILPSSMRSL